MQSYALRDGIIAIDGSQPSRDRPHSFTNSTNWLDGQGLKPKFQTTILLAGWWKIIIKSQWMMSIVHIRLPVVFAKMIWTSWDSHLKCMNIIAPHSKILNQVASANKSYYKFSQNSYIFAMRFSQLVIFCGCVYSHFFTLTMNTEKIMKNVTQKWHFTANYKETAVTHWIKHYSLKWTDWKSIFL